jgi:predicted RNA-binding Zn ribbon-like protein
MKIMELPLVGGHPALDLVNTLDWDAEARDYLASYEDLVVWFSRTSLTELTELGAVGIPPVTDRVAVLARVIALRSALRLVLFAQLGISGWTEPENIAALALVADRNALAASRARLVPGHAGEPILRVVGTAADHHIEDRLADSALELLTHGMVGHVSRCPIEKGGCGWFFLDQSRNSSRTWCRMEDCGNRVKSRALTERRRRARAEQRAKVEE